MCKHKSKFKCKRNNNLSANQIVKFDDCIITQIKTYDDISFEELRKREQEAININKDKCINTLSAFTSKDEKKAYRSERFVCECGGSYTYTQKSKHMKRAKHLNGV